MQEISSGSSKHKTDLRFNILILQTVTVVLIMAFAVCIRLFGGNIYSKLSAVYHQKFDDITLTSEVLEPQNKVPAAENESTDSQSEDTSEPQTDNSSNKSYAEEYDSEIDGTVTGNITEYSVSQTTAASKQINTFQWPVLGEITSHYGYRTNPITGVYSMHNGLDIAAESGTNISAAYDGTVTAAGYSNSYGYYIIVTHNENVKTLYAHCSKLLASEGDTVKKGETVAKVGSTGRSTGPHLHFEIRVGGYRIDPEWMLSDVTEV